MYCEKPLPFKRPKHPDEVVPVAFDFSLLAANVTSPVLTITRFSGSEDPAPGAIASGPPQVSGAVVLQQVVGGVDGCTYLLQCAAFDGGNRWVISALLHVCAPAA